MSFASIPDSESANFGYRQLIGQVVDAKYVVESFIAEGAYGYVFRGRDTTLNKVVAIKFGREATRFKDIAGEAKRVAQLDDLKENIVEVFGFGTHDTWPYMVMEFLPGVNLEIVWEKQNRQLSPELIREFVKQIGTALDGAHARGLVHRDLKPSNIQVVSKGRDAHSQKDLYRFVLMDFGISSIIDHASRTLQNPTLKQLGTPTYMSPEHLHNKEVLGTEHLSDIYAFGVILYQLLSGTLPYPVSETASSLYSVLYESMEAKKLPPPPFYKVAPDCKVPPAIERLVRRCLDPLPQKRPQTMAEIVQEFLSVWPEPILVDQAQRTPTTSRRWLLIGGLLLAAMLALRPVLFPNPPSPPTLYAWFVNDEPMELNPEDGEGKPLKIVVDSDDFRHADWKLAASPGLEITPIESAKSPLEWNVRVVDPNLDGKGFIEAVPLSPLLKSDTKRTDVTIHPLLAFFHSQGATRLPFSSELKRFDAWQLPPVVTLQVALPNQRTTQVRMHLIVCTKSDIEKVKRQGLIDGLEDIHFPQQSFYLSEQLVTWEMYHAYIAANPHDVEEYIWNTQGQKMLEPQPLDQRGPLGEDDRTYEDYVAFEAETNPHVAATNLYPWMALKCCRWIAGPEATLPSAMEWDWVCGFTQRARPDKGFPNVGPIQGMKKTDDEKTRWEMVRTLDKRSMKDGIPSEEEVKALIWNQNLDGDVHKLKLRMRTHNAWPENYDQWDADNGGMSASTNIAADRVFRIAVPLEKLVGRINSGP